MSAKPRNVVDNNVIRTRLGQPTCTLQLGTALTCPVDYTLLRAAVVRRDKAVEVCRFSNPLCMWERLNADARCYDQLPVQGCAPILKHKKLHLP